MDLIRAVIPVTDIKGKISREQLERLLDSPCFPQLSPIVCFDACESDFIKYFEQKYPFIESVVNKYNRLNFARNANLGLRKVREAGDSAILINQDCKLPDYETFMQITKEVGVTTAKAVNELDFTPGTGEFSPIHNKFAFYCVFIHKDVLQKVGLLEGAYVCTFEDDDYIARSLMAGFNCFVADVPIYHQGSFIEAVPGWTSASGSYDGNRLGRSKDKYYTKYQIPQEIEHGAAISWILENHVWQDSMCIQ